MKTIFKTTIALLFLTSFFFISCEIDNSDDNDGTDESGIILGLYKKAVGGTYLKVTSTHGYLCIIENGTEFSGELIGNTIHLVLVSLLWVL